MRSPIPVAELSKARVCGQSLAEIAGSNTTGGMDVCESYECCVLSGRGLCDGAITRPEESYRLWCVIVCDPETSSMRRPWPALGCSAKEKDLMPKIAVVKSPFLYCCASGLVMGKHLSRNV